MLIDDFMNLKGYKPKTFLIRNGCFIGVYFFNRKNNCFQLWKKINNELYGYSTTISLKEKYEEWGCGGHLGISGLVFANEAHLIPEICNLNNKNHLKILGACLGGCHIDVHKRLKRAFSNFKKGEKKHEQCGI